MQMTRERELAGLVVMMFGFKLCARERAKVYSVNEYIKKTYNIQ